jgi:WD40 repeat protein
MFKTVLFLVLGMLPALTASAQGFQLFNGRNHPELKWQVAETAHFRIMYPRHLAGIEAEAAPIAEATYTALSRNLGVSFDKKIRIYLSDEDEILNGFAVRIGNGHTNIWVHVNDVATTWSGQTKWLRTVLSHELAHLFHYRAVEGSLGFADIFFGDPLPNFWTEGFAQYQTERWDAYRGDQWLRTAVLDDRLSYEDGRSIWNGRLLYASGNAQLRYFADRFGDSTLAAVLAHREKYLFGLVKVHDFYAAFEETTDKTYREYFDDWRRHMNVYYNTLAGQMENPDSLGSEPLTLPGQYLYDVRYSPDTTNIAVVSVTSIRRPVRRLYVVDTRKKTRTLAAEGSIDGPVSWSPDGQTIAFSRLIRGERGSLLSDLFTVRADGKKLRRLTNSRRASSPAFSPDGRLIAFIGSDAGTANLFLLDPVSGREQKLTHYSGDVQIGSLAWHPFLPKIAFARFDADGRRDIQVLDIEAGTIAPATDGTYEDHGPIWSPDGKQLAYTSLRDRVPNIFAVDLDSGDHRRVTNLVAGARVVQWVQPDSLRPVGSLVALVTPSKEGDEAHRFDAARTVTAPEPVLPAPYTRWLTHEPPNTVPARVAPDPNLIVERSPYRSLRNLTHVASLALPYYNTSDDWGVAGVTSWTEPLGKHLFALTGSLSIPTPRENSFVLASYINNQWVPSINLNAYSLLPSVQAYGDTFLADGLTGGDLSFDWPIDLGLKPYTATRFEVRARYLRIEPLNESDFQGASPMLPAPAEGRQADLRLSFVRKRLRPYADNLIHPLDGHGWRLEASGGARVLGGDTEFVRGEVSTFAVLPAFGLQRLYVYGRAAAILGDVFPQHRVGFSRFDDLQITAPEVGLLSFVDADRVRGYRAFALGNRMAFGTVEYRMPVAPSLQTTVLGVVSLGATTLALFADGGMVWQDRLQLTRRLGVGAEVKNVLVLGGALQIAHAIGIGQPYDGLGTDRNYDLYYRLRAALPF